MTRHPATVEIVLGGRLLLWGREWLAPVLLDDDERTEWTSGRRRSGSRLDRLGFFSTDRPPRTSRVQPPPVHPAWSRAVATTHRTTWAHHRDGSTVALRTATPDDEALAESLGAVRRTEWEGPEPLTTFVISTDTILSLGEKPRVVVWNEQLVPVVVADTPDDAREPLQRAIDGAHLADDPAWPTVIARGMTFGRFPSAMLVDLEFAANLDEIDRSEPISRPAVTAVGWFDTGIADPANQPPPFTSIVCGRRPGEPLPSTFEDHALNLILRWCNRPLTDDAMVTLAAFAARAAQVRATFTPRFDARALLRPSQTQDPTNGGTSDGR